MNAAAKFPKRGELVIGTITKVNPFSVGVRLDEYPDVDAMIHISEVARKWIKDIRDFVKEGEKVVLLVVRVDEDKGFVGLSLKRVSEREKEEKLKESKREMKATRMIGTVAKKLGLKPEEAQEKIGNELKEKFGEMFKAFKLSMTEDGYKTLLKRGVSEEWARTIKEVAEETMEIKEKELKGTLELTCYKPNGAEIIRKVLSDAEKKGVVIRYISAPKWSISYTTKEAKKGEKKLIGAAEEIAKSIRAQGGEAKFEYK
ncbi:MAG: S1 RNA-binding domain-containing protein [Candidatus Aenigmatarchaeota archaeon]